MRIQSSSFYVLYLAPICHLCGSKILFSSIVCARYTCNLITSFIMRISILSRIAYSITYTCSYVLVHKPKCCEYFHKQRCRLQRINQKHVLKSASKIVLLPFCNNNNTHSCFLIYQIIGMIRILNHADGVKIIINKKQAIYLNIRQLLYVQIIYSKIYIFSSIFYKFQQTK